MDLEMSEVRSIRLAFCLLMAAAFAAVSFAQAGRVPTGGAGKNNQRTAPTPLPVPSPDPTPELVHTNADDEIIRVNTQLVSIPVRVMDKKGRFVGGLAREN